MKYVYAAILASAFFLVTPSLAATKAVDLDGNAANGAESQCDLNVIQTFPVQIENKVTNKAAGDAYNFSWKSAGPGGFTSSVTAGSTGGVGAKWTWTTNQTVYSYTGSTCDKDICFTQTAGPDSIPSFCSYACLADATSVTLARGATAGTVVLNWVGGQSTFTVYRSTSKTGVVDPANAVGTTDTQSFTDAPPAGGIFFYVVRGVDCTTRKACVSNADCSAPGDGTCVSRGPFGVPGRSLLATDVTVSAASLTSSLVTFFSPPKEVFRVTSTAQPGGSQETVSNNSTSSVTVVTADYPPGCCPPNADGENQLRCGETCVDYLNDPANCGACGNVCGDGTCCSNGNCVSLCGAGQTWCDGQCIDLQNDNASCGTCNTACGDGTCCSDGGCASICDEGDAYCGDGLCADVQNDNNDCGACGNVCGDGTCCSGGACASVCAEGQTWCNGQCVDFQNDSGNCGACGSVCGDGTCCGSGTCNSVCGAGEAWCDGLCADIVDDSNNCGACGNVCGEGTCCNGGSCVSVCADGEVWCNGQCVDIVNDTNNCGTCGNVCGAGTCCSAGVCASECSDGRTYCDGLCYDTQNDPNNCGGCGNVCDSQSICSGGTCQRCTGQGGAKDSCDNRCVNLNTDSYNCGACGNSCQTGCPSNYHGVCSNGNSCTCVAGSPTPPPPSNIPPPTEPVCPNPNPSPGPTAGVCPNPDPSSGPVPGVCSNPNPTVPVPGACPNPTPSSPVGGVCPNPDLTFGPAAGVCPNHDPSYPSPGACPDPGPPAPAVDVAPICQATGTTTTLPPGGSATTCNRGGLLFKEVPTEVLACGDSLPGPDGLCQNGVTHVSTGTFMRLVPDDSKTVGDAYITPYRIHIISDTSGDGLLEPDETASVLVEVLNAGMIGVNSANATLTAPPMDVTQDGLDNPVGLGVSVGTSSYGTIQGTQPTTDCTPPALHPTTNATPFVVTVPPDHPGDTSHLVNLAFSGTVNDAPFSMNVPIALGIADRCNPTANTRDYDGLDGLSNPMARLVPVGDPVPFPSSSFTAGNTRPLKLRVLCNGVNLSDATVDPPQIIALSEATRGALDISALNLNSDSSTNPNDPFFRFNNSLAGGGQWVYNMRTALIGTGTFTVTIKIAGRKDYVTGFVLE